MSKPNIYNVIATDTTEPRDIRDRFSDVINVKDFGAVGDGIHDDTEAIQKAIDSMKNGKHYIVFPFGTYIISSSIITSAQSIETGTINLNGSTIKASADFTGEFMIELGGKGEACSYKDTINITYFCNGVIDANSLVSGIRIKGMHLTTIENINVINITDVGIQIDESDNSSSDSYIRNVFVSGIDKVGSKGLFINSNDNEVDGFRSRRCPIGIDNRKGGFLSNCHPIYGLMDDNYNDSVGFILSGGQLTNCYADNFSVAFRNVSTSQTVFGNNLVAFWYTDTEHNHIFLQQTGSSVFLWSIQGASFTVPTKGNNKILDLPSALNTYTFSNTRNGFSGFMIAEGDWKKLSNPYNDFGLALPLYKENSLWLRNNTEESKIIENLWYPLCVVKTSNRAIGFKVNISGNIIFKITAVINTSSDKYISNIKVLRNSAKADIDLGVSFYTDGEIPYAILYYKVNNSNVTLNTHKIEVENDDFGPYLFYIPRTAYNYDEKCNGLSIVDGLSEIGHIPSNEPSKFGSGYSYNSWSTTHIIPISGFNLSGYERLSIIIQSNNKNAIWEYFVNTLTKIKSDIGDENVTISDDNIVITTTSGSVVKVTIT